MLRRIVRNVPGAIESIISAIRLAVFSFAYPGFRYGRGGRLCRSAVLKMVPQATITLGDRVVIDRHALVDSDGELSIGADSYIGQGALVVARERVNIGSDALIAAYCTIRDHDHGTGEARPYRPQRLKTWAIILGRYVWLGAGSTVLKGVLTGDNAVIGAGSVVMRNIAARQTAVGVQAREKPMKART